MRVGFLGAYSIDNPGDALIGLATRCAIAQRCPEAEHQLLAPAFPEPLWRHEHGVDRGLGLPITPVAASPGPLPWAQDLSALIIGGGGILSPEPSFRPFLLGLGADDVAPPSVPAAWNAVCSQGLAPYLSGHAEGYAAIRRSAAALRHVSVRNRSTATFLRACGYHGPLHVVPDPAIGLDLPLPLPGLPPLAALDHEVDDALVEAGATPADLGRRLVGVSLGRAIADPRAEGFFSDLLDTLVAQGAGPIPTEIVVFPFGAIYDDLLWQHHAASALAGHARHRSVPLRVHLVARQLSPLVLFRLISRLHFYLCTRLHAMLAAYTQDVPFLILDEYLSDDVITSKIREFIVDRGLWPFYLCPYLSTTPGWKLRALLNNLPSISFKKGITEDRLALSAHFDALCSALHLVPSEKP